MGLGLVVVFCLVLLGSTTTGSVIDDPSIIPTKPTFPPKFYTEMVFNYVKDIKVPEATASFDLSGLPSTFEGRENFTARGAYQSTYFKGSENKIYMYSRSYRGKKCLTMEMSEENLWPHPAYKVVKYLVDWNMDTTGDKYYFRGRRLAFGWQTLLWGMQGNPDFSLYEYIPPGEEERVPLYIKDGERMNVHFPIFLPEEPALDFVLAVDVPCHEAVLRLDNDQ